MASGLAHFTVAPTNDEMVLVACEWCPSDYEIAQSLTSLNLADVVAKAREHNREHH